ncbi:hypothetical protein AVEN_33032-1 [Araneus ventricosus]|uniref:Uncharacterized protein n=1 Tax=Araneus ventricosus TaxID=182803 RepID=A0A4Y2U368_ARAVE|nr:hypothetical protein AVEN_189839-1 [Araneus ventricosus]GBO06047.1 hypothetical protein AVEN_33032-1 [Araneus ventricosus]
MVFILGTSDISCSGVSPPGTRRSFQRRFDVRRDNAIKALFEDSKERGTSMMAVLEMSAGHGVPLQSRMLMLYSRSSYSSPGHPFAVSHLVVDSEE